MSTQLATPIQPRAEFRGILRDEERLATGRGDVGDRLNGWFDRLMVQSGTGLAPSLAAVLCLAAATALGGAMWVLQENPLSTGLAALLGFVLPIGVLSILRSRRRSRILGQIAEMVDELTRAARTGRSLEACLEMVGEDTPAPLGTELRESVRKVQMGLPVAAAMRDLPERTGVDYLGVFTMALVLHQESGGDLVHVLERLSQTVRDRIAFLGRLKVATVASRWTAILMLGLPPLILLFYVFYYPSYLSDLLASVWGRRTLFIAIALQIVGSLLVLRILKTSQRA